MERYARIRFKNSELLKFSVLANQTFCFSRLYGTIITITNMLTILYYDAFEFENMSKKEILPKVFAITFRFLFLEKFRKMMIGRGLNCLISLPIVCPRIVHTKPPEVFIMLINVTPCFGHPT